MIKRRPSSIILLSIILISFGCKGKEEKKLNEYGDYWRLVQNTSTGNCALIEKTIADDGSAIYTATASVVASGRCVESNFFTFFTNADEAKARADVFYNGMILVYNNYSECADLVKTTVASRDLNSVSSITDRANGNLSGCVQVFPKVYYCKDTASLTFFRNQYRYVSIANAKSDMRTNYDSIVSINAVTNKALDLKYDDVPLGNLRIANAGELSLFEGAESRSLFPATAQDSACFKKIILGNTNLKTAYAKIPTVQEFFKEEINVSDRKAITETLTQNLVCRYGTKVSELPANGTTGAIGVCPPTYPSF